MLKKKKNSTVLEKWFNIKVEKKNLWKSMNSPKKWKEKWDLKVKYSVPREKNII